MIYLVWLLLAQHRKIYNFEGNLRPSSCLIIYVRYKLDFQYNAGNYSEPGSSVNMVSGYGLGGRALEVRSPAKAKEFFLWPLCPDRLCGPPSLLYNGYRRVLSPE
jgi:hypothetical protein